MQSLRRARWVAAIGTPRAYLSKQATGGGDGLKLATAGASGQDEWARAAAKEAGNQSPMESLSRTTPEVRRSR